MPYDTSTQWYQSKGGGAPFAVTGSAQKSMDIGPASQYIFLGTGPTPPVVAAYTEGGEKPLTVQNIHTGEVKNVYGQNAQRNLDTAVWKPYTGQILYETTTPEQRRQAMSNIPNQEIAKMQFLKSPTAIWAPGESFYNAFVANYGRAPTAQEQFGVITPETEHQTAAKAAMLKSSSAEYATPAGQVFSPSEIAPTGKEGQSATSELGFYTAQTRKMVVVNPDFKPASGVSLYVSTPEQKAVDRQMMTKYGSDYLSDTSKLSTADTQKLVGVGILKYEAKTTPAPSVPWTMPTDINPATGKGYAAPEPQTPSGMYVEKTWIPWFHTGAEKVVNVISQWENIADIGAARIETKLPPIASVAYPALYSFGRGAFFEAPKMTVSAVGLIPGGTEAIIKTQGKVLVPAAIVSAVGLYESSKEGITTKPFEFAGTLTGQAALFEGAGSVVKGLPSLKVPSSLKEFAISEEVSSKIPTVNLRSAYFENIRRAEEIKDINQLISAGRTDILETRYPTPEPTPVTARTYIDLSKELKPRTPLELIPEEWYGKSSQISITPSFSRVGIGAERTRVVLPSDIIMKPAGLPELEGTPLPREAFPYGRYTKLPTVRDMIVTPGEELVPIPKARIPTTVEKVLFESKPESLLPEIPKARIPEQIGAVKEGKVTIQKDIGAQLESRWAERETKLAKQASKGAQLTRQGQILLTKQEEISVPHLIELDSPSLRRVFPISLIKEKTTQEPMPQEVSKSRQKLVEKLHIPSIMEQIQPSLAPRSTVQTTKEISKVTQISPEISVSIPSQISSTTPESITKQISKTVLVGVQKEAFILESVKVPIEFGSGGGEVVRIPKPLGAYIPDQFAGKKKRETRRKVSSYTIKNPLPDLEELISIPEIPTLRESIQTKRTHKKGRKK